MTTHQWLAEELSNVGAFAIGWVIGGWIIKAFKRTT